MVYHNKKYAELNMHTAHNKRASGSMPTALRPNAFAKFITVKLFSGMTRKTLSEIARSFSKINIALRCEE